MTTSDPAAPSFLDVIHALVRDRLPPSALRGVIGFCVKGLDGDRCWYARFDRGQQTCGFSTALPHDCDVILVMDETESEAWLATGAPPEAGSSLRLGGNKELAASFFENYLQTQSWLSVRADATREGKKR